MCGSLTFLRAASRRSYAPGVFNIEDLVCESIINASFWFEEGKKTCFKNMAFGGIFGGTWSFPPPYKAKPYKNPHGNVMEVSWKQVV